MTADGKAWDRKGCVDLDYNGCLSQIQTFLQNSPLIVLGAGASIPYGLPSMNDLAIEIEKKQTEISDSNFSPFCDLMRSLGLEMALDQANLQEETHNKIRQIVWDHVNCKDLEFWKNYSLGQEFALSKLISKVLQATPNKGKCSSIRIVVKKFYRCDNVHR